MGSAIGELVSAMGSCRGIGGSSRSAAWLRSCSASWRLSGPGVTLAVLVLLFGVYAIVDGVLALYVAVRSGGKRVWAPLREGVVGIGAGLVTFFLPGLTALVLLFVIAAWAILTGVLEVIMAVPNCASAALRHFRTPALT
jgi:hypothetical protein